MSRQFRFRQGPLTRSGLSLPPAALLLLVLSLFSPIQTHGAAASPRQTLTFEERVAAQRAIEEVYWRYRIWPEDNPQPKPPLDDVLPEATLRAKVEDYLRLSNALEKYWQRPVTGEQLQGEMERMARDTEQPEVLRELWAALNHDPLVIAECLARPALAEYLARKHFAAEPMHGELQQRAAAELARVQSGASALQTSGRYESLEWEKTIANALLHQAARSGITVTDQTRLDAAHALERVNELTGFDAASRAVAGLRAGEWSGLQVYEHFFFAFQVLERSEAQLRVARIEWRMLAFDEWWHEVQGEWGAELAPPDFAYRLPQIVPAAEQCASDTWTATSTSGAPSGRDGHVSVWTGSEMIVWGGFDGSFLFNTGRRYNPAIDAWTATSTTDAPSSRSASAGVWTGTELVIWGGSSSVSTGGRYNPIMNSWRSTTTTNSPSGRSFPTAVWTGTEMIVWGGSRGTGIDALIGLNTGGRYNPSTDTWSSTSTAKPPGARLFGGAVWTGSEMLIWGGFSLNAPGVVWNTGGRYSPLTDTWKATSLTNAPSARQLFSTVWTGSEMIVWGGEEFTGGRYNPTGDRWTATSTFNAPGERRTHSAVWTGSKMIVWGGQVDLAPNNTAFNTGGLYNPFNDSWTATSSTNAPSARYSHQAVWTGDRMIVWGGRVAGAASTRLNTGGRYCFASRPGRRRSVRS